MNPLRRAVASVIRLVGAGMVGLSLVLLALSWVARHKQPSAWWQYLLYAALAVAGVALLLRSKPLAARFTDDFED